MIRYGAALLFLAGALLVRWAMDPLLGNRLPLSTVYAAIVFAVLWGGTGPGLLVGLLGYVAADLLFIAPRGELVASNANVIVFGMHAATTAVILLLGHLLHAERTLRAGAQRERDLLETRARIALEAAQLGSYSWFPPERVVADARCQEIGQLPRHDRLTLADINRHVHPDDLARVQQARQRALDPAGDGRFAQEYRFVRDDGSVRFVASHGQVEFAERDGRRVPVAMHGAIMDITSRVEEAERLREADRRKDEFLATLAHELRNPLAPIRNAVELLRLQYAQDAGVQRLRGLIDRQLRQLTRLVDDLLEVSRITRGVIPLRRARFDLAAAVGEAVEGVRQPLEEARHTLDVRLPAEPLVIDADEARITQVVQNLLHNAVRYTPHGGHIVLEVAPKDGGACIVVRDTGIGIPPGQLARVFEMFARGTTAMEHNREGLGIGLALVKGIVAMHGGRVAVASDGPGRGSTFTVWLPLAAPSSA